MREFILATVAAILLAALFGLMLNSVQETVEVAFSSDAARLNLPTGTSSKGAESMSLLVGVFGAVLGAMIGGLMAYQGSKRAAELQVRALEAQRDEERVRFQQMRHQKKYGMALASLSETKRICIAAEKRRALAESARSAASRHPSLEQMMISRSPLIRGEREDIGLLSDQLQDSALALAYEIDEYNEHVETIPRTAAGPISIDEAVLSKLGRLIEHGTSITQALDAFIRKVREWRCQRCEAFIDEVLDVIEGGRKRCPICGQTARAIQIGARL
jgi:rubrerythrin